MKNSKNIKKIIVTSLLFLVSYSHLYAQYFNHSLDIDSMPNAYRGATKINNSYYVGGDVAYVLSDSSFMNIAKYSNTGNLLWNKKIGNIIDEYFCNRMFSINYSIYIIGTYQDNNNSDYNIFAMKLDTNGNQEWVNYTGIAGKVDGSYSAIITSSDDFIIVGSAQQPTSTLNDAIVVRIDTNGTILWEERYGYSNSYEWASDVVEITNNEFLVSGISTQQSGDWDKYVFKIDGDGTMLWDTIWGTTGTNDRQVYVNSISEGYALAVSGIKIGSSNRVMSLYDFDANGDIVWQKDLNFGNDAAMWRVHKNNDGTFILYGSEYTTSYEVPYMLCVTPRGDTLWSKIYRNQLNHSNYIYDMLQNEDNSYVFVGVDWPLTTNGWIKSLDCMGCDSIQCYFPDSCFVYDCHNDYPPEANFTLAQDTFYYKDGDTVSIKFKNSSSASAGYTWFMGTGDSLNLVNPKYDFTAPGDYEITLVARNVTCTDTAKATLHILDATGISELNTQNTTLQIVPNPFNEITQIMTNASGNIIILDNLGRKVLEKEVVNGKVEISYTELNHNGIYFVLLQTPNGETIKEKLILVH